MYKNHNSLDMDRYVLQNIHYVLFGALLALVFLLAANLFWKRRLMKEEQLLIAQGKEAAA